MKTTLLFFLFATATLCAAVRSVNLPSLAGATNYASVTAALTAAGNGDIVYVAAGVYTEAELTVPTGVTLIGGLPAVATVATQRIYTGATSTAAQWTILDGSAAHRVATVNGTLEGCVIRNGKHTSQGGGVYIAATGTVQNCYLRGNQCQNTTNTGQGGAAFLLTGAKLINCVVDFNMANAGVAVAGAGTVTNNTMTHNCNSPLWIRIPAGTFRAGDVTGINGTPAGAGADNCTLTADFYMAQTETTNAQYAVFAAAKDLGSTPSQAFSGQTGSPNYLADGTYTLFVTDNSVGLTYSAKFLWVPVAGKENSPMVFVSWYGALAYSSWLGGKLPTEAQWEYAARRTATGFSNHTYAGSNTVGDVAWTTENSSNTVHSVAGKGRTALRLYDMTGNVWEWCSDWHAASYPSVATNPVGATTGTGRIIRGGGYTSPAGNCTVSTRFNYAPSSEYINFGFRPIVQ
jgi:formylglycine-generating enzyme required for sulfatase activity